MPQITKKPNQQNPAKSNQFNEQATASADATQATIPLVGMTCAACAGRIQTKLRRVPGVREAHVNFVTERAVVTFDGNSTGLPELVDAVRAAGYDARVARVKISIPDLQLNAPTARPIEAVLRKVPGVTNASVNLATQDALIDYVPGTAGIGDLQDAIRRAGYEAGPVASPSAAEKTDERRARSLFGRFLYALSTALASIAISMPLMMRSGSGHATEPLQALTVPIDAWLRVQLPGIYTLSPFALRLILLAMSIPVVAWAGGEFYRGAWRAARHRAADSNTLIALGTATALLYSIAVTLFGRILERAGLPSDVYYTSVAAIIAIVLLGRLMVHRARRRALEPIRKLVSLRVPKARVERNGQEVEIDSEEVMPGDVMLVRTGEKIAVDGVIVSGSAGIDESFLTGGPRSVTKESGATVFGATLNSGGALRIRATTTTKESTLSQVIRRVEDAQSRRAPIQRVGDAFGSYFVPIVVAIAIATFIAWYDLGPAPALPFALIAFAAVLLIVSPCTAGLAAPAAVLVGTARAASRGALIRGGETLERLAKVNLVVLDKSGALTEGRPAVSDFVMLGGLAHRDLLRLTAAVEKLSEHPIARAIVHRAEASLLELPAVSDFSAVSGKGVEGTVENRRLVIGSASFLKSCGISISAASEELETFSSSGKTAVLVAIDRELAGILAVADALKESSARVVDELKRMGLEVRMLSGDSQPAANGVAREAGIGAVSAEVLPEEKGEEISRLQREGATVAMVGHGINDAVALARAEVGVAIGSGTAVTLASSDVTLIRDDLDGVVEAIRLARATMRTIRRGLWWSFIFNVVSIAVAAGALYPLTGALLSPVIASVIAVLSTLLVLRNTLRLRTVKLSP